MGYCMDFKLTRLVMLMTTKFKSVVRMLFFKRRGKKSTRGQEWPKKNSTSANIA